jgi:hypothetical protein
MPVSFEFLRGTLAVVGLGCAYMSGRSAVAVRKGWIKLSKLYGWLIRTFVCLAAIVVRHPVDTLAIAVWCLSVVVFGIACWHMMNQKPPEDLTNQIFPHEQ